MAKWKLLILLMIALIPIVTSLDLCPETKQINRNCTMVTPEMDCQWYQIFNLSGSEIVNTNLSLLNGSIYYLNFTEGKGSYAIRLCDGTTREVIVNYDTGGNDMILGILVLSPILLAFLFMFIGNSLNEEHAVLKLFLMLLSIVLIFTSWHFGIIAVNEIYAMTELVDAIGDTVWWVGIVYMIIIVYFIIQMIRMLLEYIRTRKKERFEY
jgi:hypothetical protein